VYALLEKLSLFPGLNQEHREGLWKLVHPLHSKGQVCDFNTWWQEAYV